MATHVGELAERALYGSNPSPFAPPAAILMTSKFTGALSITYVSLMLFGVVATQGGYYYHRFPEDPLSFKLLVGLLLLINVIFTVFMIHYQYNTLINNFGDLGFLSQTEWDLLGLWPLDSFAAIAVQWFYCYRVYRLVGSALLAIFIACLGLCAIPFSIYVAYYQDIAGNPFVHPAEFAGKAWVLTVAYTLPAATDFIIFCVMAYGLMRFHRLDLPKTSQRLINKVLFLSMDSMLVTTAMCITAVATYQASLRPISSAVNMQLPRVYAATLLVSLLARKGREYKFEGGSGSGPISPSIPSARPYSTRQVGSLQSPRSKTSFNLTEVPSFTRTVERSVDGEKMELSHSPRNVYWDEKAALAEVRGMPFDRASDETAITAV